MRNRRGWTLGLLIVGHRSPDVNIEDVNYCGEAVEGWGMWLEVEENFGLGVGVLRLRLPCASFTAMLAQNDRGRELCM